MRSIGILLYVLSSYKISFEITPIISYDWLLLILLKRNYKMIST
jgi:hypothetical protein